MFSLLIKRKINTKKKKITEPLLCFVRTRRVPKKPDRNAEKFDFFDLRIKKNAIK